MRMSRQRMTWVLIAFWLAVGGLAVYQRQNPSPALNTYYTLAFGAVFAASLVYLYLRMRRKPPQD